MKARFVLRAAVAGLAAWAAALLVVTAVVTGYAATLGASAGGEPDPARVGRFATLFSPVAMLALSGAFAFLAGRWAGRGADRRSFVERAVGLGLVVGAATAAPPLLRALQLGAAPRPSHLLLFAVAAALAILGAATGVRRSDPAPPRHAP